MQPTQIRTLAYWGLILLAFFGLRLLKGKSSTIDDVAPPQHVSSTVVIPSTPTTSLDTTNLVVRWPHVVTATAMVTRVVDGDTVEVVLDDQDGKIKVRMLGINTPESVDPRRSVQCFGKEASQALKRVAEGRRVALIEDPQADDRDKYGRLLRTIVLEDGMDVNATLVKQGFAHAYLSFPLSKARKAQLSALQREAEQAERGLWNPLTCSGEAYPAR